MKALEGTLSDHKTFCLCGCGQEIAAYRYHARSWRRLRYKLGHHDKRAYSSGSRHYNWKGGRYINGAGYVILTGHYDHPRNSEGRIFEHILVYEQYHTCCVLSWGVVHHINGDKQDNRIENLEGLTHLGHRRLHTKKRVRDVKGRFVIVSRAI